MPSDPSFPELAEGPIFVVGAARSGTTWVYDVLTAPPEVAGIYESWLFTRNEGLAALFRSIHWPAGDTGLGRLLPREALVAYVRELAVRVMRHALGPGHRFLVEKSPTHVLYMPLISEIFPAARFVHVIRDGRDVAVSVRAAASSWAPAWRAGFGRSVRATAAFWKLQVERAARDGAALGERYLEIRYEDMHRDPLAAYRRLYDFSGIGHDDAALHRVVEANAFRTRFRPHEAAFRRGGRVGDWRTELGIFDALAFEAVAGSTLVTLGYEKNHRWLPRLLSVRRTANAARRVLWRLRSG